MPTPKRDEESGSNTKWIILGLVVLLLIVAGITLNTLSHRYLGSDVADTPTDATSRPKQGGTATPEGVTEPGPSALSESEVEIRARRRAVGSAPALESPPRTR